MCFRLQLNQHLTVSVFFSSCTHIFDLDEKLLATWDQLSFKKLPNSLLDNCNCTTSNVTRLLQNIQTVNFDDSLVKAKKIVIEGDTCDCYVADDEMSVGKIVFANAFYEDFGKDIDEDEDEMLEFSNDDSL